MNKNTYTIKCIRKYHNYDLRLLKSTYQPNGYFQKRLSQVFSLIAAVAFSVRKGVLTELGAGVSSQQV